VIILPGASHYDEVASASPSFKLVLPAIKAALGLEPGLGPDPSTVSPSHNK
jgi:hypothetical protein